jgi:uncharacterized protein YecA (UPF0149 family)
MDEFQRRHLSKIDRDKKDKSRLPGDDDAALPDPVEPIQGNDTPGRNDPCSCGSGKKYKKCCGKAG